jgi:hypothetical protein
MNRAHLASSSSSSSSSSEGSLSSAGDGSERKKEGKMKTELIDKDATVNP